MTSILEPTDTASTPSPVAPDAPALPRRVWLGFTVILFAMILNILDSTIVNVAAPAIARDLGLGASALEWVAAAYTLALAVGILTGARLGDMLGRRRVLLGGLAAFTISSILCSLAWSGGALIGSRAAQGLAAAVMVPQTFGLIRDLFPPQHIGKAFAAFGPVIGLSTVLGPVVAGLLMQADVLGTSWRALFWINVPVGVLALLVGRRALPEGRTDRARVRLDVVGTVLFGLAAFLLVFPLVDGRTLGWPAWVFAVMAASLPVLAAFVWQQRSRLRAGRDALVEVTILRKRSYLSGVVFTLFFFGSVVGFSLTTGLFLQLGLGFGAMHASLYLAAMAVGAFVGSGVGAWAATAVGRPILHVGLSLMAAGALVLWASMRGVDGGVGFGTLAPGLFLFGVGMGMIFVPLFSIIMGDIEDHEVGSASGFLESLQQLGASLGVAVLGTLFFHVIDLEHGGPAVAAQAGRHLAAAEATMLGVVVAIAVAWVLGWLLPRRARPTH